jgi:signal transduction histidine kinase
LAEIKALEDKIRTLSQEALAGPDHTAFHAQLNAHLVALVEHRAREAEVLNQTLQANLAELKRRKERMVTTVHDLKVPLTVSLLNLELAEMEEEPAVKAIYLNGIKRELEFLLETIANMIDLERPADAPRTLQWELVALRDLVADVEARMLVLIKDKPELVLRNEVPAELPPLRCDRHLFTRVLTNLFSNAIKYTDRGSITVGANVETPAHTLRVFVRDTGSGIDDARKAGLFQLFQGDVSRYDSSGVGLVFVNTAVAAHGGRVWLTSEPAHGTCVYVELPLDR